MKIERFNGEDAAGIEDELRQIYREAFAESPYHKTEVAAEANFRRFRTQVKKAGFRAVLARSDDHEPIGMAYGYPLLTTTGWWDTLTEPVPADVRREDGYRTFGLFELAVRPGWRRQHTATALHRALLDGLPQQRVLLNTRPDALAARTAYQSWGYQKIGESHPWTGAVLHDVLILDLSARADSVG
jgi:ribosomal protein S18 acetylase RimI-like enzyme